MLLYRQTHGPVNHIQMRSLFGISGDSLKFRWFDETGKISAAGLAKGRPVLYDRKNSKNLALERRGRGIVLWGEFPKQI